MADRTLRPAPDPDRIAERLETIRHRIEAAGGDPDRVQVLAVTKGFAAEAVLAAMRAGLDRFGENYADELVHKATALAELPDGESLRPRWHFIGPIQRNKLARLSPLVDCYEGVTRLAEGQDLARRRPGVPVLVEVDTSGIPGRPGLALEEAPRLIEALQALELTVRGVMTVAPPGGGAAAGECFAAVAELARRLGLETVSMGMSDDLEAAVAAGSTEVRVGTALFGPR